MKIVIAPDSFKENLTSMQVATCLEKGIKRVLPKAKCVKVPMADGGEGTVQSLVDATGGKILKKTVVGPLGEPVQARYGILGDGKTAIIEMAEASGLPLIPKDQRDPLRATTYGTGELILDALARGVRSIIIGIGGSATVDGGAGMAQALGVRFLDQTNQLLSAHLGGGMLDQIAHIDMSGLTPKLKGVKVTIASDVDNPLCGKKGAAHVFGPQKGATAEMVLTLDQNLKHFAGIIKADLKISVAMLPGAGAAGGLGAGLVAFTSATLQSGIDLVVEATNLHKHLVGAQLVVTGEGRVDSQTAFGKTPAGVAKAAKKYKIPVVAVGGGLADDASAVFEHGIDGLVSATPRDMSLAEALAKSKQYLENAGERMTRLILIGVAMEKQRLKRKASK
jgi:glycerate 2-kinase